MAERFNVYLAQLSDILVNISLKSNRSLSITEFLTMSRQKRVLILGKDSGSDIQRLRDISLIMKSMGYDPIIVKDQPDIAEMSNEDKVRSFADASRFVLLENSFPAGQIAECKIMSTNRIVTATIREEGTGSSYMVTDYHKDFDFMNEFTFNSLKKGALEDAIDKAVEWAEIKIAERREFFDKTYHWRAK